MPKAEDKEHTTGVWIWGPPGVGKSHYVRHNRGHAPDTVLTKNCNKWFNDWKPTTHKVVLLDDFDRTHTNLGHYLKIWADKYSFQAEVKGGTMEAIRPDVIYITSNYSPLELWPEDHTLREAIEARFELIDARQW